MNIYAPMTIVIAAAVLFAAGPVLADDPDAPIRKLDDPTRVKVLAAIAALVILGFGMVLLTWLGARVTQRYRYGSSYFRPTGRPGEHDWAKKPLAAAESKPDRPRAE